MSTKRTISVSPATSSSSYALPSPLPVDFLAHSKPTLHGLAQAALSSTVTATVSPLSLTSDTLAKSAKMFAATDTTLDRTRGTLERLAKGVKELDERARSSNEALKICVAETLDQLAGQCGSGPRRI
ncbi:uncharacterized protein SPPG_07407 [Spizellomyces punctatus DAOM BR117]|uniref:Uncharacterized protein n=1 Tax=Spizellomyces punctatus (strain DAOM BR117) TaxID=645134 RepID=A0A0L0H8F0_SPIPD|nr:uncharacterized protein SPPG_07407 [Spizellomyces punctatus DAOM BR117]KNC97492.1 hypothetical protein SPPG_07407 [Spizellomyces punctatus DAOM BR117]|eukprot:XP_016605532.1 hypothetical protein SPPG_07407 [Spizellomyces punctatus DAOM BR117]